MPLTSFTDGTTAEAAEVNANFALCVLTDTARTISASHTFTASQSFTGLTFSTSLASTTALATPSALSATQYTAFASTASGATIMGYGTTYDVTLKNRAGTDVLGIGPNTTDATFAGKVAIGGGILSSTGLRVANSALSGTQQIAVTAALVSTSGATSSMIALYAQATSATASFTMTAAYGIYVENTTAGAGSTITTAYGINIADQTGGGTNYALYTNAGLVRFGGAVTCAALVTASAGLTVASGQTLTLTGGTVAGTPTWSSSQAITLSTAAQPNITSVGTLTSLGVGAITSTGVLTLTTTTRPQAYFRYDSSNYVSVDCSSGGEISWDAVGTGTPGHRFEIGGFAYLAVFPTAVTVTSNASTCQLVTSASSTTRAGLNVPHGTAPTSPADGDIWTTTAGLFARINGVTIGPYTA